MAHQPLFPFFHGLGGEEVGMSHLCTPPFFPSPPLSPGDILQIVAPASPCRHRLAEAGRFSLSLFLYAGLPLCGRLRTPSPSMAAMRGDNTFSPLWWTARPRGPLPFFSQHSGHFFFFFYFSPYSVEGKDRWRPSCADQSRSPLRTRIIERVTTSFLSPFFSSTTGKRFGATCP